MRMLIVMALCLFFTGLAAWGAEIALLQPASAGMYRASFTMPADAWQADDKGLLGTSPQYYSLPETAFDGVPDDPWSYFVVHPVNLWRYALAGKMEWTDYTLSATVSIEQPAPLKGHRPGDYFFNYQWGREAIGSDAGLIVRYTDPDNYYMVRLSSGYGHVELWKTHGGVVQMVPHHFIPNHPYKVNVTVSGRWIIVEIDGREILRYADPILPLRNGQVGLGVRESQVRFNDVQVMPAAHLDALPPAHKPDFHLRKWVGREYIFDGEEPVGYFMKNAAAGWNICEVKLLPGLMPLVVPGMGMVSYTCESSGDYTVTQQGKTFAFTAKFTGKDDAFTEDAAWTLSYDPAVGYIWDKRATITMLKDKALTAWPELDDPYFYQIVGATTGKLPKCRTEPNYCLKLVTDGSTVAFPNAQHLWTDGASDSSKEVMGAGGAQVTTIDGWGVVTDFAADNTSNYITGYCHWGLDQHIHETSLHVPAKGESYSGHLRYYVWDPARVRKALTHGVLPPANRPTPAQLIANVEPLNHCDTLYPGLTGESVRLWTGNYTVDHTVGRGDTTSMRIDTAAIKQRLDGAYGDERPNVWLGPTYWTGPYLAPRYRFGIWVKADQFTGKVIFQADNVNWTPPAQTKFPAIKVELPIQGKCDWTYLSFEATFPRQVYNWVLRIDPVGTGIVWVDDIDVTPLAK